MQIAKMFATLGFKVDTTGIASFKTSLSAARAEITNMGRGTENVTRKLRGMRKAMSQVSTEMAKLRGTSSTTSITRGYQNIASSVRRLDTALNSISINRSRTTQALGKIHASVLAGIPHWDRYRESVVRARRALHNINGELARLRANSRIDVRINRTDRTQGGGAGGNGGSGGNGGFGNLGAGMGAAAFMRNIIPMAGLGLAGGAGFAAKATVEAAREQTRMESTLLMTSKSQAEYANTLKYVREESAKLGLSSVELGKSYAQINMSARGLSQDTKKEMFTGFSEFMMSMGTSADDQKGIFRAFNQMFSNNRLLQEEINQLSDRGIPATLVYDAAMKAYDTKSMAKIKKLQEDGKLDPNRVLPVMAKMVQDLAHDSGAYAKMMESSIVKQGKMFNQLSLTSKEIMDSGLDEWLGKVFGQLTELVLVVGDSAEAIKYLVTQIKELSTKFNELTGSNTLLSLAMFFLLFRFKGLSKGVRSASRILVRHGKIGKAIAALFTGGFGKALGAIILRFTVWTTVIWGTFKALSYLGKELKKDQLGGWTFFDEMALKLDVVSLKFQIVNARAGLFWQHLKNFSNNPIMAMSGGTAAQNVKGWFGGWDRPDQSPQRVGNSTHPDTRVPAPWLDRVKPQTMQGILDESKRRAAGSNGLGVNKPQTLNAIINVKVGDTTTRESQVVNMFP